MFIDVLGLSMIIYVSQLYFPRCPLIFLIFFAKHLLKEFPKSYQSITPVHVVPRLVLALLVNMKTARCL